MFKLSGAHHALLNTPITAAGGSTSAAAIRASQTYVALRTTLAQELPELIRLTEKALTLCIGKLVELQAEYYHTSAEMWHDLYDKLHDHESADANVMALYEERVSGPLSRIQALRICAPLPDKKRRKSGGRSAPQVEGALSVLHVRPKLTPLQSRS